MFILSQHSNAPVTVNVTNKSFSLIKNRFFYPDLGANARKYPRERKGQLRFDTDEITVCKRSVGWTHYRTDRRTLTMDMDMEIDVSSRQFARNAQRLKQLNGGHDHRSFYA